MSSYHELPDEAFTAAAAPLPSDFSFNRPTPTSRSRAGGS